MSHPFQWEQLSTDSLVGVMNLHSEVLAVTHSYLKSSMFHLCAATVTHPCTLISPYSSSQRREPYLSGFRGVTKWISSSPWMGVRGVRHSLVLTCPWRPGSVAAQWLTQSALEPLAQLVTHSDAPHRPIITFPIIAAQHQTRGTLSQKHSTQHISFTLYFLSLSLSLFSYCIEVCLSHSEEHVRCWRDQLNDNFWSWQFNISENFHCLYHYACLCLLQTRGL